MIILITTAQVEQAKKQGPFRPRKPRLALLAEVRRILCLNAVFNSYEREEENLSLLLLILQVTPSHNWFLFLRFADEVTRSSGSSLVTLGTSSPSSRSSTTLCSGFCHRLSGSLSSTTLNCWLHWKWRCVTIKQGWVIDYTESDCTRFCR